MMSAAVGLVILAVAVTFAFAACAKLADASTASRSAVDLGVPRPLARLWPAIPLAELGASALLIHPTGRPLGGLAALVLLAGFTALVARSLLQGARPACNCFGSGGAPIGGGTLVRNGALAAGAALCVAGPTAAWDSAFPAGVIAGGAILALGVPAAGTAMMLIRWAFRARHRARAGRLVGRDSPLQAAIPDARFPTEQRTLLIFVHPDCGPCRTLLASAAAMAEQAGIERLIIVAAADAAAAESLGRHHRLTEVVPDPEDRLAEAYGVVGTPTAYLAGPGGSEGPLSGEDAIRRALGLPPDGDGVRTAEPLPADSHATPPLPALSAVLADRLASVSATHPASRADFLRGVVVGGTAATMLSMPGTRALAQAGCPGKVDCGSHCCPGECPCVGPGGILCDCPCPSWRPTECGRRSTGSRLCCPEGYLCMPERGEDRICFPPCPPGSTLCGSGVDVNCCQPGFTCRNGTCVRTPGGPPRQYDEDTKRECRRSADLASDAGDLIFYGGIIVAFAALAAPVTLGQSLVIAGVALATLGHIISKSERPLLECAFDPPRDDYTVRARASASRGRLPRGARDPAQRRLARSAQSASSALLEGMSLLRAATMSLERAQGAQAAGDSTWEQEQLRLASAFSMAAARRFRAGAVALDRVGAALRSVDGLPRVLTRRRVALTRARVRRRGLPPVIVRRLRRSGVPASEVREMRAALARADLRDVPQRFPLLGLAPMTRRLRALATELDRFGRSLR